MTVKKQTVTKVALSKKSVSLNRGKKLTLKATCTPTNAYNKSVTWSTNNKNVAVVNSKGKVTAKRKGTCYITATAKDGSKKYARCKVVVKKKGGKIILTVYYVLGIIPYQHHQ